MPDLKETSNTHIALLQAKTNVISRTYIVFVAKSIRHSTHNHAIKGKIPSKAKHEEKG